MKRKLPNKATKRQSVILKLLLNVIAALPGTAAELHKLGRTTTRVPPERPHTIYNAS